MWRTMQTLTPEGSARRSSLRRQKGFSLIELLIAIGVLLTIAAIAVPAFLQALDKARVARCVGDLRKIGNDVDAMGLTTGVYPTTLIQVDDDTKLDPWGSPYVFVNLMEPSSSGAPRLDRFNVPINKQIDLYSMGADKLTATPLVAAPSQDDVIWASDGGYLGLASQY